MIIGWPDELPGRTEGLSFSCKVYECEFSKKSDLAVLNRTGPPLRCHPWRLPANANVLFALPLSFYTFQENINTLRQNNWKRALLSVPGVLFPWAFLNFALKMIFANCHKIAFLIQKNRKNCNFCTKRKGNHVFAKIILFPNAKCYVFVLFWRFLGTLVQKLSVTQ